MQNARNTLGNYYYDFIIIVFKLEEFRYLFFIQAKKTGHFIKGSKWWAIFLMGILTIASIANIISLKSETFIEFPDDHAVYIAFAESMGGILLWAWFALFWNLDYIPYKNVPKGPSYKEIKKNRMLLDAEFKP